MRIDRLLIGLGKGLAVAVLLAWSLVPIAFVVISSFKPGRDIFAVPPRHAFSPTLDHYAALWTRWGVFFDGLWNSLLITAGATALAVIASTCAGYVYSRNAGRLLNGSVLFLIVVRLIPPIVITLPLFPIVNLLGLNDTHLVLMVLYATFFVSLGTVLMRTFIDQIPRELDEAAARAMTAQFLEVLIAPAVSAAARAVLARKGNVRVLEIPPGDGLNNRDVKRVGSGLLMQDADVRTVGRGQLKVVTRRQPTPAQLDDLMFAWRVARFVKSNAIVYAGGGRTLGIGAGQMSRVDSARIAARKALDAAKELKLAEPLTKGSVVASDAFFPFADGMLACIEAGATAVIQPGGSMRDDEVIKAADDKGLAMVLTGQRHFRH